MDPLYSWMVKSADIGFMDVEDPLYTQCNGDMKAYTVYGIGTGQTLFGHCLVLIGTALSSSCESVVPRPYCISRQAFYHFLHYSSHCVALGKSQSAKLTS